MFLSKSMSEPILTFCLCFKRRCLSPSSAVRVNLPQEDRTARARCVSRISGVQTTRSCGGLISSRRAHEILGERSPVVTPGRPWIQLEIPEGERSSTSYHRLYFRKKCSFARVCSVGYVLWVSRLPNLVVLVIWSYSGTNRSCCGHTRTPNLVILVILG